MCFKVFVFEFSFSGILQTSICGCIPYSSLEISARISLLLLHRDFYANSVAFFPSSLVICSFIFRPCFSYSFNFFKDSLTSFVVCCLEMRCSSSLSSQVLSSADYYSSVDPFQWGFHFAFLVFQFSHFYLKLSHLYSQVLLSLIDYLLHGLSEFFEYPLHFLFNFLIREVSHISDWY